MMFEHCTSCLLMLVAYVVISEWTMNRWWVNLIFGKASCRFFYAHGAPWVYGYPMGLGMGKSFAHGYLGGWAEGRKMGHGLDLDQLHPHQTRPIAISTHQYDEDKSWPSNLCTQERRQGWWEASKTWLSFLPILLNCLLSYFDIS